MVIDDDAPKLFSSAGCRKAQSTTGGYEETINSRLWQVIFYIITKRRLITGSF
jgi:hypothetical protein